MDIKDVVKFIVMAVVALIIFGTLVDYGAYYTSSTKTPNVTGLGRVIVDLMVPILAVVVLLIYLGYV
jgi:membrane protein DedA with SNARE-associated domain